MAPGSNIIKLFSFSLISKFDPIKPSLIIGIKAGAYPSVAPFRYYTLR